MNARRGRHLPDSAENDDPAPLRTAIARALLLGGRLLPVVTIAAVAFSRLTRASWAGASIDEAGFTTAWQPNVAAGLSFVLGFALPFIVLPVASSALVTRDGSTMTAPTVMGRRTVDLARATAWRARLPGRGPDTQVVVLRSWTGWVVVMASESWVPRSRALFAGETRGRGLVPGRVLAVRGWALILLWAVIVLVTGGVGSAIAGF